MWLPRVEPDPNAMERVREARRRGDEVHLVTGRDTDTDTFVVFWHIVSTNELVMEGARLGGEI